MDPVALISAAFDDLAEEDNSLVRLMNCDVVVHSAGNLLFKLGELKIVGGKKGLCFFFFLVVRKIFRDRPSNGDIHHRCWFRVRSHLG